MICNSNAVLNSIMQSVAVECLKIAPKTDATPDSINVTSGKTLSEAEI